MAGWDSWRSAAIRCTAVALLTGCSGAQSPISAAPQSVVPSARSTLHSQSSRTYRVLFSFGSNVYGYDGAAPEAGLIDVNGALYGTTAYGGAYTHAYNEGTVFSIGKTGKENILHSFGNGSDGGQPVAGLIDAKGTLYGTTVFGGAHNDGTVFSVTTTGTEKVLYSFRGSPDGLQPRAGLVDADGALYGTTYEGGAYGKGSVFSVRIADGKEKVLHSFSDSPDGAYPLADLVSLNGTFYGTTFEGGSTRSGAGTVFSISTTGTETVLLSFGGSNGAYPYAGLIAQNGTLYGTTGGGGAGGLGTVFSVSTGGIEKVLHSFGSGSDGVSPVASLIATRDTLYGTTSEGGALGAGTVFRLRTDGTNEQVLHSFGEDYKNDGSLPKASLLRVNHTLYGTTLEGGISLPSCYNYGMCDYGTVFALKP